MLYLIVVLILLSFGTFFFTRPKSKNFKYCYSFAFAIFVCVAGLRYNLGVDYFLYVRHYIEFPSILELSDQNHAAEFLESSYEPGFKLLMLLLRSISHNSQLLFFVASIISTTLLFKALREFENRKVFFLSLCTYFCAIYLLQEMQALRQALAAGFVYCAFAARLHSLKKAYLWLLVGCCMHNSALLFLVVIPFLTRRFQIRTQLVLLLIALLIFTLRISWLSFFISSIGSILPDVATVARLMNYVNVEHLNSARGVFITFILYIFVYLVSLFYYRRNGYYSSSKKLVIGQNLLWLYLLVTCFTWEISFISIRYGWYFLFGLVICLPQMIFFFKRGSRKFAFFYVCLFNLVLLRPFVFPNIVTLPFSPYEDYISCVWFGSKSTGRERADQYLSEMGVVANLDTP